jgi:NAD(P) transhydrogenase subunit alpha
MVKEMKTGSIIVDLSVESGGNCASSVTGKVVEKHGVKIMGYPNFPARIPFDASQVYARNALNFLTLLFAPDKKTLNINWDDEIVVGAALYREGAVTHPLLQAAAAPKKQKEKK